MNNPEEIIKYLKVLFRDIQLAFHNNYLNEVAKRSIESKYIQNLVLKKPG